LLRPDITTERLNPGPPPFVADGAVAVEALWFWLQPPATAIRWTTKNTVKAIVVDLFMIAAPLFELSLEREVTDRFF
jgi:hypothetical protein